MSKIHKIIEEFEKSELAKLKALVAVYKDGVRLIKTIDTMDPVNPEIQKNVNAINECLRPYREIYLIVGDDVEHFLYEEIGTRFNYQEGQEQDSEDVIAIKLLKLISTTAFITIRKTAASACSRYNMFLDLYTSTTNELNVSPKYLNKFQSNQIQCVQIFSHFSLLSKELNKAAMQTLAVDSATLPLFALVEDIYVPAGLYSNILQPKEGESKLSSNYVARGMLPLLDAKQQGIIKQIEDLKERLNTEEQKTLDSLLDLWQGQFVGKKMLESTDITVQNELIKLWKVAVPTRTNCGESFPTAIAELSMLSQEIAEVTNEFGRMLDLLTPKVPELDGLLKKVGSIQDNLDKFSPGVVLALRQLNQSHHQACRLAKETFINTPEANLERVTQKADYSPTLCKPFKKEEPLVLDSSPRGVTSFFTSLRSSRKSSSARDKVIGSPTSTEVAAAQSTLSPTSDTTPAATTSPSVPPRSSSLRLQRPLPPRPPQPRPDRANSAPPPIVLPAAAGERPPSVRELQRSLLEKDGFKIGSKLGPR